MPKVKKAGAPAAPGQNDPSEVSEFTGAGTNGPRGLPSGAAADEKLASLLTLMTGNIPSFVAKSSGPLVSHS